MSQIRRLPTQVKTQLTIARPRPVSLKQKYYSVHHSLINPTNTSKRLLCVTKALYQSESSTGQISSQPDVTVTEEEPKQEEVAQKQSSNGKISYSRFDRAGVVSFRQFKRGAEAADYIRRKFTNEDSKIDIIQALIYFDKMLFPVVTNRVSIQIKTKVKYAFKPLLEDLMEAEDQITDDNVLVVLKIIATVLGLIFDSKEMSQVESFTKKLYKRALDNCDSYEINSVTDLLIAYGKFKFSELELIEQLAQIIMNRFLEAGGQEQASMLYAFSTSRYYNADFSARVQQAIKDGTLVYDDHSLIRKVTSYFSMFGVEDQSVWNALVDSYLADSFKEVIKCQMLIYNMACGGASSEVIQKLINGTIATAPHELLQKTLEKEGVGLYRRAQLLQLAQGEKIVYPGPIEDAASQPLSLEEQQMKFPPSSLNKWASAVFAFLQAEFPEAILDKQKILLGGAARTDIGMEVDGTKIAIETRLPTSYAITKPKKLLSAVKVIFQLIEYAGYQVVLVDGERFLEDESYKEEIKQLLQAMIEPDYTAESYWKQL